MMQSACRNDREERPTSTTEAMGGDRLRTHHFKMGGYRSLFLIVLKIIHNINKNCKSIVNFKNTSQIKESTGDPPACGCLHWVNR